MPAHLIVYEWVTAHRLYGSGPVYSVRFYISLTISNGFCLHVLAGWYETSLKSLIPIKDARNLIMIKYTHQISLFYYFLRTKVPKINPALDSANETLKVDFNNLILFIQS